MGKSTISVAIFNSKLLVYQMVNLHFPMVFLWFSYGFQSSRGICGLVKGTTQIGTGATRATLEN